MTPAALVLDFGGVVTRTLFETHDVTERALGLAPGSLTWRGPFDVDSDSLWRRMQDNEISERDYWHIRTAQVGRMVGEDWTEMAQFVRRARGAEPDAVVRPEAVAAIAAAKAAGHVVAVLSNELDLFYGADFRERLTLAREFDAIVDATHTGILKPDPRAYALLTEAIGRPAQACVFVDDQLRNVDGARAAGMQAVHFDVRRPQTSYAQALSLFGL
jgi:putative hydrolase of the HAD superfamily